MVNILKGMVEGWKQKRKKAKEEKDLREEVMREAKLEALRDMKDEMVRHYKQKELDKLKKGNDGGFLGKIGKEFSEVGEKVMSKDVDFGEKLGMDKSKEGSEEFSQKIKRMLE